MNSLLFINSSVVLFLFCFCSLPNDISTQQIRCFQCNSAYNADCADIKPNDTLSVYYKECEITKEMGDKEVFCRKLVQRVHDRDGLVRVVRRCAWIIHPRQDCYTIRSAGHEETSCQCFTDGCNSATNLFNYKSAIICISLMLFITKIL